MNPAESPSIPGLTIAAVERETGLSKDTLRVWEKRYGFPQPLRDAHGDRVYPAQQVQQLQLIQRLLASGMRPGKVVGLDLLELQQLRAQRVPAVVSERLPTTQPQAAALALEPFLQAIAADDPQELRTSLHRAQARLGMAGFICDLVAPLTTAVGDAWSQGRFEVFEEHLYTEVLTGVLHQAIATVLPTSTDSHRPKVLLTTLPSEAHGLGLLMVEALLTLEGCTCVSLGTQTPHNDIIQAAAVRKVDIVALSFSAQQTGALVLPSLLELRKQLPPSIEFWAGGSCSALYEQALHGITVSKSLTALPSLVAQWRNAQ